MSIETILAAIEELEEIVDSRDVFAQEQLRNLRALVRKLWPRAKRLVFVKGVDDVMFATGGRLSYWNSKVLPDLWIGADSGSIVLCESTEPEMIAAMQSHFNAAWQAMTEVGE